MSPTDWALLILAGFWAVLVVFLAVVSIGVFRALGSTTRMIEGLRTETLPLLRETRTTVTSVNRNLEQAETILVSAGHITHNVERISTLVDQFVSLPLIKAISWAYGVQQGVRRFRGEA